jgi:CheY-like chemotaxis protein
VIGIKVLILEDDATMAELLRHRLEDLSVEVHTETDPAQWAARSNAPGWHIVVTDLMKDSNHDVRPGDEVVEGLFASNFAPIVIHSGFAGLSEHFPQYRNHPFVRIEPKSPDSVEAVAKLVEAFLPLVSVIAGVKDEVSKVYQTTLSQTAEAIAGLAEAVTILPHLLRRRIAATFDDASMGLGPFDRYLIPPTTSSLRTGDILHLRADPNGLAQNYRLVLTQSCDLVWRGKRNPKVQEALVAATIPISEIPDMPLATDALVASPVGKEVIIKRIPRLVKGNGLDQEVVTQLISCAHPSGLAVLPGVPGVFNGPLVFDFKKVELIPLSAIEQGCNESAPDCTWKRLASQDSPFREQITWAFLSVIGRPAVPDVDQSDLTAGLTKLLSN